MGGVADSTGQAEGTQQRGQKLHGLIWQWTGSAAGLALMSVGAWVAFGKDSSVALLATGAVVFLFSLISHRVDELSGEYKDWKVRAKMYADTAQAALGTADSALAEVASTAGLPEPAKDQVEEAREQVRSARERLGASTIQQGPGRFVPGLQRGEGRPFVLSLKS